MLNSQELTFLYGGKGFNHYKFNPDSKSFATSFEELRDEDLVYYTYVRSLKTKAVDFQRFCTIAESSNSFSM